MRIEERIFHISSWPLSGVMFIALKSLMMFLLCKTPLSCRVGDITALTGHCDGWLWTVSWIIFVSWRPGTAHSLVSHPSWAGSNWGGIRLFILYSNYHGHSALQTSHYCARAKLSLTWMLDIICWLNIKILTTSRRFYFSVSTWVQFRGGGGG